MGFYSLPISILNFIGHRLNIDRDSESDGSQFGGVNGEFGENGNEGLIMERNMFYIDEQGIRLPGTSRYQYHSKTSVEIFSEIKEAVSRFEIDFFIEKLKIEGNSRIANTTPIGGRRNGRFGKGQSRN